MAGIENYFVETSDGPKMAIHAFQGIIEEYVAGKKTAQEAKDAFEAYIGVTLSAEAITDLNNLVSYVNAGIGYAGKKERLSRIYNVLILSEAGIWYDTRVLLRARIIEEIS